MIEEVKSQFTKIISRRIAIERAKYMSSPVKEGDEPNPSQKKFQDFVKDLLILSDTMRFYTIASKKDLDGIWEIIRENELLLDTVMSTIVELRFFLNDKDIFPNTEGDGVEWFIDKMVDAVLVVDRSNGRAARVSHGSSAIDNDTFERLPTQEQDVKKNYKANDWYIFVFLLNFTSLPWDVLTNDTSNNSKRPR